MINKGKNSVTGISGDEPHDYGNSVALARSGA